jgi:predicted MFS family arabinose efflux permease
MNIFQAYRNSFSGLSRQIWVLASVALVLRSGTMVVPFLTVYLTVQKNFSLAEAGLCMSFFGMGSVLGSYLGGLLIDKYGTYWVQFGALLSGGILIWALGYADTVLTFSLLAFLLSTFTDSFRPAVMAAVVQHSQQGSQTRSLSLIRLAINLGFSIGPSMGGIIAQSYGYSALFWADGAICLGAWMLFWVSVEKKAPSLAVSGSIQKDQKPLQSPYKDRKFLIFIALLMLCMIVFMQLMGTFPVYLKSELHMSETKIGSLLAANGLLIAILEMPLVFSMEKRFKKLDLVSLGAVLIAFSYLALTSNTYLGAWACILFLTFGEIIQFPFSNTYVVEKADKSTGSYMGMYFMAIAVAQIVAPFLGMSIAQTFGFGVLWLFMAFLGLASAFGFWQLSRFSAKT